MSDLFQDKVETTRRAADSTANLFNHVVGRGEDGDRAQRFVLQCVVAMFAEDLDMIPSGLFTDLVEDCRTGKASTYDLFGQLFRQMSSRTPARAGRFEAVPGLNAGLFEEVDPIELVSDELALLASACEQDWAKVEPPIFGELFQHGMGEPRRHALGAHFTLPAEIHRVITPTLVTPWRQRIAEAKTATELLAIAEALTRFRVLDPACGSGNFLYLAYRELKRLETEILSRVHLELGVRSQEKSGGLATVSVEQLYGIDVDPFAVELAKVELLLAKKLALDEANEALSTHPRGRLDIVDQPLPLENIRCGDALFVDWPEVDAIIGNPPYQAKNKAQGELSPHYMHAVRRRHPEVSGQADYCVYWFRRAHDELPPGGRAGLVGTSTIRHNKSRAGGLDYIVGNGGTITEAVSTQVWPGEAVVHVSIVNWIKGTSPGPKTLWEQKGDHVDSPWEKHQLPVINSALSPRVDVTSAKDLRVNLEPKTTFQGQTPGVTKENGFVIPAELAATWIAEDAANAEIVFKYLIGDDLLDNPESSSDRFILDFGARDLVEASRYQRPFEYVKQNILERRRRAAEREAARNTELTDANGDARVNKHHATFLKRWWQLAWRRGDMLEALSARRRYIACSRVTRRPIFELVSSEIHPGDALQVFALDDDYSFGILQSDVHWQWFTERCSGLKIDPRYTSGSVYSTFPWPQAPSADQVTLVARAGAELRELRRATARRERCGLRALYRVLELPGDHPIKDAHRKLDDAVRAAYRMKPKVDVLQFLLDLNHEVAEAEADGDPGVLGPGLPPALAGRKQELTSMDCVAF